MQTLQTKAFRGLNNVTDPMRLGLEWLVQADNIDISDTGALSAREGYSLRVSADPAGRAFNTADFQRAYIADGLMLKAFDGAGMVAVAALTSRAPLAWAELNEQVYFTNGADAGIILPDHSVLPWMWTVPPAPLLGVSSGALPAGQYQVCFATRMPDGRLTGAGPAAVILLDGSQGLLIEGIPAGAEIFVAPANSATFQHAATATSPAMVWNAGPDSLGADLTTADLDPLPSGVDVLCAWRARLWAAEYSAADNQSAVWSSEAFGAHLFNLARGFMLVPGRVLMLAAVPTGIVIGTDAAIHFYDGATLAQLADYGVVPGQHWDREDASRVLFWSQRGVCRAMPFANLTEDQVSVAPGLRAGGALIRRGGQRRYVVSLHAGGSPFNPH